MSKAILLSIKPQWLAKILNGEKTIEVRKKFPKDYVGWVYLYCSKGKNGYAIHIYSLEIFNRPKELSEFYTTKLDEDLTKRFDNSIQLENGTWVKPLTKAPQSWCYIEGE